MMRDAIADLVRRADPDRYLSALFAPAAKRSLLHALYAFNIEIARVADTVREPMIGEIRLEWWRETLAGARQGMPRNHDVARALTDLFAAIDLPHRAVRGDDRGAQLRLVGGSLRGSRGGRSLLRRDVGQSDATRGAHPGRRNR